jgi:hypothetical protein
MIRIFCDICGKEITNYKTTRAMGKYERLTVEVIHAIDGVWNGGHACVDCLKLAASNLTVEKRKDTP